MRSPVGLARPEKMGKSKDQQYQEKGEEIEVVDGRGAVVHTKKSSSFEMYRQADC